MDVENLINARSSLLALPTLEDYDRECLLALTTDPEDLYFLDTMLLKYDEDGTITWDAVLPTS